MNEPLPISERERDLRRACSPPAGPTRGRRASAWLLAGLLLVASAAALAQPTVNGLFYGDGDDALYQPYATSIGGSVLYSYFDVPTSTLYVALVVSHQVNDLVCAQKGSGNAYLQSGDAGDPIRWTSHRDCKRATDSEFASFTLECAPGSPRAWSWQQALGCALTPGTPPRNWASVPSCPASVGVWPPSIVASSSWVANVNAYQAFAYPPGNPAWNMYVNGQALADWKTPFVAAFPNDVTQVPGYPTYSYTPGPDYQWEWSMVYEWSVNLGPGGADCANQAIFFVTGESHHSPPKSGPENDTFPPPQDPPIFSDWGDLPDSYLTTNAVGGPQHYLKVDSPYLGTDLQMEADGTPTADASGDGSEEDGLSITVTDNWVPGSTQTIQVTVTNATGSVPLAGWFDWNGDGVFDASEYVTWTVVNGVNNLTLTVGAGFDWLNDNLSVRLRIFSSSATAPGGSLDSGDFGGVAQDGEVEDYVFGPGSLPVALNAFATEYSSGSSIKVRWQTASETDNVGFEVLGRVDGRWRPLAEFVASKGMNSALPQRYETEVFLPPGLTELELVDYSTSGQPERFGPFRPGASYGEFQQPRRVDWTGPRASRSQRLVERGLSPAASSGDHRATRWRKLEQPGRGSRSAGRAAGRNRILEVANGETLALTTGPTTHVAVTAPGIQRVPYEALRDAGLDLAGVRAGAIAVTWRGEPVARWVEARGPFGPGSWIEFVGRPPQGEAALYLGENLYQVSVDPARARAAARLGGGKARRVPATYTRESVVDRPGMFHRQSTTGDPWVEQSVLVRGAPVTVDLEIPVDGPVRSGAGGLFLELGTISDLPDLTGADGQPLPEHNVEVWLANPGGSYQYVTTESVSGRSAWKIEAELPEGTIRAGVNRLRLRFSSDYFFSLIVIDRYGVRYPGPYRGPELDFAAAPRAGGYRVRGFASPSIVAYAESPDGSLTRLDPQVAFFGAGFAAELRQVDGAHYWVTERPHAPAVFTTQAADGLLDAPADLVVIADSSFVGTAALDAYLAQRADLRPVVVDVEDIYNGVGFGMALPGAITDYLRIRDRVHPFSHVQLVGTDCYDRRNYLSDCVSFIPLPTAPIGVNVFSPSQNRLVDLDDDGVGDRAVAQFSVRDEAELETIVRKADEWSASGLSARRSALLIAEETDGLHDFVGQARRLQQRLGWPAIQLLDMSGHPEIETARQALGAALEQGRTVTVFSGHSSPSLWAFRALLTAEGAGQLANYGKPTLMVPLACETTYDISPDANVLGHQLLYAGEQGALAITGAVALSSLAHNELMAGFVLDGLSAGLTLGEAVQAGRQALGTSHQTLQDNWMTQGDVAARITP